MKYICICGYVYDEESGDVETRYRSRHQMGRPSRRFRLPYMRYR